MTVSIRDFQPINNWMPDFKGEKYTCCSKHTEDPLFIIDESTNRRYSNESQHVTGLKCFLLTLGTPVVHSIGSLVNLIYRIAKLITLSHFWIMQGEGQNNSFKARLGEAGEDLLRLVATPFAPLGLELAALYGTIRPYDGRKLYASIERGIYGNSILAPCFQPDPKYHAFGGEMGDKDAF